MKFLPFLIATLIVSKEKSAGKSSCLYFLGYSSEIVNLARPFARREASTLRPLAVAILKRNPCLFFLLRLEG
jgi:hypothetical protein